MSRPKASRAPAAPLRHEQPANTNIPLATRLIDLTLGQLLEVLDDRIGGARRPAAEQTEPLYLTGSALAAKLGVSRTLVHRWAVAGMPCLQIGDGVRRYRLPEVLAWLESREVRP